MSTYKSWRVQEQTEEMQKYIVQVDFNDNEGNPGTCWYGPFTKADADNFSQSFSADDPEIEDAVVLFLNSAVLKEFDM